MCQQWHAPLAVADEPGAIVVVQPFWLQHVPQQPTAPVPFRRSGTGSEERVYGAARLGAVPDGERSADEPVTSSVHAAWLDPVLVVHARVHSLRRRVPAHQGRCVSGRLVLANYEVVPCAESVHTGQYHAHALPYWDWRTGYLQSRHSRYCGR